MAVIIKAEPRKVVIWDEFRVYPAFSIALDGYCSGLSRSSPGGLRLNINHHEGDDIGRLTLRSACDQALVLVKLGLFEEYQIGGEPEATLWVNDCDQDVVFATYVLMHPDAVDHKALRELVRMEDYLDVSAGLFPVTRRSNVIRRLAWITEEYDRVRTNRSLYEMDGPTMETTILSMHERVTRTLFGKGKELSLDTRYRVIARFPSWVMVEQVGPHARIGMSEDGIRAFVSVMSDGSDGGPFRYTIARRSQFIPMPLLHIAERLNEAEGIGHAENDRWGGADTVIGSPRERGSRIEPASIGKLIEGYVSEAIARCPAT